MPMFSDAFLMCICKKKLIVMFCSTSSQISITASRLLYVATGK